jgi:AcrR family transcriptional regulator
MSWPTRAGARRLDINERAYYFAGMTTAGATTKGERTRAAILDAGMRVASQTGLDGLTIGALADTTGLSKSGLFAHFGSRDELLLAVLAHVRERFTEVVVRPALDHPRGVPRLRAMFVNWLDWTESADLPGGCPMVGAAAEYDDRPGAVRDALAADQRAWGETLKRAVLQGIDEGQLAAGTDAEQIVFELFGVALVTHHHRRLLGYTKARSRALAAFEALVARSANR